jgi:AraC-like DNA-binding protein
MFLHLKHVLELKRIAYYRAPHGEKVTPYSISKGEEIIELTTAGGVWYEHNGEDIERQAGNIFWHQHGEHTIHRSNEDNPYECMVFAFLVRPNSSRPSPRFSQWFPAQEAIDFCWQAYNAFHVHKTDPDALAAYLYSRLHWQASRSTEENEDDVLPRSLAHAMRYIETHFHLDLQVPDIATTADLSVPHLHHLFRKHLGTTPHRFIMKCQMHNACQMLRATDAPIKEICRASGFQNIETFCRAFRRHHKTSPSKFRQLNAHPKL